MRLISKSVFLRQFAAHGIGLDSRYSPPQTLVFEGVPEQFTDLTVAENWAVDKTRVDHKDRTILVVPESSVTGSGLVARNAGVIVYALDEMLRESRG